MQVGNINVKAVPNTTESRHELIEELILAASKDRVGIYQVLSAYRRVFCEYDDMIVAGIPKASAAIRALNALDREGLGDHSWTHLLQPGPHTYSFAIFPTLPHETTKRVDDITYAIEHHLRAIGETVPNVQPRCIVVSNLIHLTITVDGVQTKSAIGFSQHVCELIRQFRIIISRLISELPAIIHYSRGWSGLRDLAVGAEIISTEPGTNEIFITGVDKARGEQHGRLLGTSPISQLGAVLQYLQTYSAKAAYRDIQVVVFTDEDLGILINEGGTNSTKVWGIWREAGIANGTIQSPAFIATIRAQSFDLAVKRYGMMMRTAGSDAWVESNDTWTCDGRLLFPTAAAAIANAEKQFMRNCGVE